MKPAMKKSVIMGAVFAAVLALAGSDLFARGWGAGPGGCPQYGPGGPGHGPARGHRGGKMAFLKEELKLSDAQVEKIFDIKNEHRKQMFKLRDKNASREQIGKLYDDREKAIEKVFTPEQLKKYQELRKERGPRPGSGPGRGYGPGPR